DLIIVDKVSNDGSNNNLNSIQYSKYYILDEFLSLDLDVLFAKIEYVFHIGACSSTTEKDMDFLMENNVNFSKRLFKLAAKYKVPFIYASSAATYGDGDLGYSDSHNEISKLKPLNFYGDSKQIFDLWALKQLNFPPNWFGFKFFNVFGPNEYHKDDMRSLVHKGFQQINASGKIKLFKSYRPEFADGEQKRDFIYVVDVVSAMINFMNVLNPKYNGIYNLGTGQARTFLDLIKAVFKSLEISEDIEFIEMPEEIKGQYQYFTQAEMDKFKQVLPDFKFHSLEEAVNDYILKYLNQSNPYY
ncbi:MAG: ADP-glyceromanno-heptose 6-epimerase, partial [Bdellovibrionales bacterium]|nr:ADP-glyceromanno-heptose 6-epimerase [Bdellovibrionales bacterium]